MRSTEVTRLQDIERPFCRMLYLIPQGVGVIINDYVGIEAIDLKGRRLHTTITADSRVRILREQAKKTSSNKAILNSPKVGAVIVTFSLDKDRVAYVGQDFKLTFKNIVDGKGIITVQSIGRIQFEAIPPSVRISDLLKQRNFLI